MPAPTNPADITVAGGPAQPGTKAGQVPYSQRLDNLEKIVNSLQNEVITTKSQVGATAGAPKVTTKGGLKVETEDGKYSFQVFGRIMADAAFYSQDKTKLGDGTELRRARIGVGGTVNKVWEYKFEADFGGEKVEMKDAFTRFTGLSPVGITAGNFHEPFSFEQLSSSRFVTFTERALPTIFAPDRHVGIGADYVGDNFTVNGGMYDAQALADADPGSEGDHGVDFTGRVTYAPILEPTQVLHFGVGTIYRNPSDSEVRFRQRPDTHITGVRYVDTAAISDVKDIVMVDPEIFYMYGPFALQGEYTWVRIARNSAQEDIDVRGWYAQASYFLTGDNKGYDKKKAKLDRTKVLKDLGKDGGIGAWEIAVRLDNLDFDDGTALQKGTEQNWTVGLNWYPNPYFRFSINYVNVNNNNSALGNSGNPLAGVTFTGNDDPQIVQVRAQVDW